MDYIKNRVSIWNLYFLFHRFMNKFISKIKRKIAPNIYITSIMNKNTYRDRKGEQSWMEKKIIVGLKAGMQARKSSQFVHLTSTFDSEIKVIKDGKTIEAKSIMGIMSIGIREGDEITLSVKGEEEQKALITLENFLLDVE